MASAVCHRYGEQKFFSVIPKIFRLAMSRLINRKKSSDVLLIRNYRRRLAGGPFRDVILGGIWTAHDVVDLICPFYASFGPQIIVF